MLYAVKGNKQLKIDEGEKQTYLKLGYNIAKAEGNKLETIEVSPSSTVPYAKFKSLQDENEDLKAQLEGADNSEEIEKLKDENKNLKAKIKELEKSTKK